MKKLFIILTLLLCLTACTEKKDTKDMVTSLREDPDYQTYSQYIIRNDYEPYYTYEGENENFKATFTVKPIDQSIIEQNSEASEDSNKLTIKDLQVDCYLTYKGDLAQSNLDLSGSVDLNLVANYFGFTGTLNGPRLVSALDGNYPIFSSYDRIEDFDFEKGTAPTFEEQDNMQLISKSKNNKDFNFEITLNRVK